MTYTVKLFNIFSKNLRKKIIINFIIFFFIYVFRICVCTYVCMYIKGVRQKGSISAFCFVNNKVRRYEIPSICSQFSNFSRVINKILIFICNFFQFFFYFFLMNLTIKLTTFNRALRRLNVYIYID